MPTTEAERALLDQVTLEAPWALVETFSTMPRWRPEDVNRAMDVLVAHLGAAGVPVEVHRPEIYLSIPYSASVMAGGVTCRAKPPSSSLSVPGGRTAPLVALQANPKALRSYNRDIATLFGGSIASVADVRARVAGKFVVMQGFGNPALTSLVEEWGGAGLIACNPGTDVHWGTCTTIWGSPDLGDWPRKPRIPVVAVNAADGARLMALAEAGGEATIRTDLVEGWFAQAIPVVTIPGAPGIGDDAERFVLLHGHLDSWEVGVGDNATGDATLLELARVLWANRATLKRGVKIAWWPGHSTGRYAGSTWFADRFALELDRDCLAQIDCDSPGCRWATSYHDTRAFTECAALAEAAIRDIVPDAVVATHRPPQAGDYSFNNIGIPSLFMLSSTMPDALRAEKGYYDVSGCGANIAWHTENDTIEIADRERLLIDMRIYLLAVLRIANADALPFDWVATCDEFLDTIGEYAKDGADLAPARDATLALRDALGRLSGLDVVRRNEVLHALGRILIPVNYTREPRFRHDPAYTVPKLPTLAVAAELGGLPDDHMRRVAQTDLVRGQNRFVAAVTQARALVETALCGKALGGTG